MSAMRQKGPVDAAKDALKTVDRKVSDKLVGGIKVGGKLYHLSPLTPLDRC